MCNVNMSAIPLNVLLGEIQRRVEGSSGYNGHFPPAFGGVKQHKQTTQQHWYQDSAPLKQTTQQHWYQDSAPLKTTYCDDLMNELRGTEIRSKGPAEVLALWGGHASTFNASCNEAVTVPVFNELVVLCYKLSSRVEELAMEIEVLKKKQSTRKPKAEEAKAV